MSSIQRSFNETGNLSAGPAYNQRVDERRGEEENQWTHVPAGRVTCDPNVTAQMAAIAAFVNFGV